MGNNRRISKKTIVLLAVSILAVLLFFFLQKLNHNNKDNSKDKSAIVKEELKSKELDEKVLKTPEKEAKTVIDKPSEKVTSKDTKEQVNDKVKNTISNEQGILVFVKAANFGSTVEIVMDSSKFNNSYKHYQFFLEGKVVSKIESIENTETTIFPSVKAGSEILLKLFDEDKKLLKELKVKLIEKK